MNKRTVRLSINDKGEIVATRYEGDWKFGEITYPSEEFAEEVRKWLVSER